MRTPSGITVLDVLSIASGAENEDRAGVAYSCAWVIDGATDIGPEPLTGAASDASWFAGEVHRALADGAGESVDLAALPVRLADETARAFEAVRRRPPSDRYEYPSASAVVVRASGQGLEYLSVGDCTILVCDGRGARRVGADARDTGDRRTAAAVRAFQDGKAETSAAEARAHVWPWIRAERNRLNTPDGYGVLSIVPPPARFVRTGLIALAGSETMLLASDGLMRLVDVYRELDDGTLLESAISGGLAPLGARLRAIETEDPANRRFPRAKTSDDATGLLVRFDGR